MNGLPLGFRVRIVPDVRVVDGGRTLVGGSPKHLLRLHASAPGLDANQVLEVTDPGSRIVAERLLAANLAVPCDTRAADPDEITVVVPIRDRAERLDRLLAGLTGLEVIVVDDASRNRKAVSRVAAQHGAELLTLPVNLGPAGARNAGAEQVTTPYVAFIDSDVVVTTATVCGLAGHFADPTIAAVAPRVDGDSRHDRPSRFERWDSQGLGLDLGASPALVRPWSKVAWVPSACLLVRRADLGQQPFEPGRRVGEDVDFVWRLIKGGRQVRYDPAFRAAHDSRTTWSAWLGRKTFYGTGGAWLAQAHGDWMAPAVFSPLPALAALALLYQRRWSPLAALVALLVVRTRLTRILPDMPDRPRLATALTAEVTVSTLRQSAHLLLRHWWPAAAVAALVSRRARRAVAVAALWDLVDHRQTGWRVAAEAYLARRLDDLAYGAGLWQGAWRARSVGVLVPRVLGHRQIRSTRRS